MRKILQLVIAVECFLILLGCNDQRILEKQGFIQTAGYDLLRKEEKTGEDELLVSVDIPKADPEGQMRRETLSVLAHSGKEAKIKFSEQTELSLVSGQLRDTLYGIKLAKSGIWEHIDDLIRDPSLSQNVKVVVVNGVAHDLLVKNYPQHPRTSQYIDRMLEKEAASNQIPVVTIYDFTRDYFDDGIDPVAPIVKESTKNITMDGIALFKKDRYITKIETEKTLIFAFLRHNFRKGEISIDLGKAKDRIERLLLNSINSHRKVHVKRMKDKSFAVEIQLKIEGAVLEYTGEHQLSKDKDRREVEKLISEYIVHEADAMIKLMQKNKVDSLGIGKYVRNSLSYEEWQALDWDEVYTNLEVRCTAKVVIKDFGKFK
ncbi:Ger(x)C family spore germination protein [Paenibacillus sp. LPE1-1-1.1]|uniref:Ger(x)C family spore germination protein n=1 Tax=Paenibacillus sp. LPE1-1-1.1 TaxID=3135230 RepID=UPI00342AE66B